MTLPTHSGDASGHILQDAVARCASLRLEALSVAYDLMLDTNLNPLVHTVLGVAGLALKHLRLDVSDFTPAAVDEICGYHLP